MRPFTAFNPFALSGQDMLIDTHGVNKGEQLVVYNYSSAILILHFLNFQSAYVPAYWAMDIIVPTIAMGRVPYDIVAIVPTSGDILPIVYGTLYEPGEHIPSFSYPIPSSMPVALPGGNFFTCYATFGGFTANQYQSLNLYNPPTSKFKGIVTSTKCFTSDAHYPNLALQGMVGVNLKTLNAAFGNSVQFSHDIVLGQPKSVMQMSAADDVAPPVGQASPHNLYAIDSSFMKDAEHLDMIVDREQFTVEPGSNLCLTLSSPLAVGGEQTSMRFTWSEVPIIA